MDKFTCISCNNEFNIEEKATGTSNRCKPCQREYRRNLYKRKKENLQGEPIPLIKEKKPENEKEKPKQTKKSSNKEIAGLISTGLQMGFGLIATRAGEHWIISNEEAESISKPLTNILSKYDLTNKLNDNMDSIALIVACGTTFIPRILLQIEINKQKNKKEEKKDEGQDKRNTNEDNVILNFDEYSNMDETPVKEPIIPAIVG